MGKGSGKGSLKDDGSPVCYINGKRRVLPLGRGEVTLLQYLREIGLTGTKLGCGEGGCGACTVMVSFLEHQQNKIVHRSVNACLAPLYSVEGCHVITVEGIGNKRGGLHPVQEKLAKAHGSQCGFCTPGFVMSMYSLLRSSPELPTEEEIEENLGGNLCRCTGYRPILQAFHTFARTDNNGYTQEALSAAGGPAPATNGAANGRPTCPSTGQPCTNGCGGSETTPSTESGCDTKGCEGGKACSHAVEPASWTGVAEPIFPPELLRRKPASLYMPGPKCAWHRPVSLDELLRLKAAHPDAKLVAGNTEVGIEVKFKHMNYPVLIAPTHVPELTSIQVSETGVELGASVTMTRMKEQFNSLIASRPQHTTSGLRAINAQLKWFAGNQIRNVSAIGGNVVTGSPISDLNPLWIATGSVFTVAGKDPATGAITTRKVRASEFFLHYRKVDLRPHEVLLSVHLPFTRPGEYVREFKQAHRREDDIAIVNAGMRAFFPDGADVPAEVELSFGGMSFKTVSAPKAAAALQGKAWTQASLQGALASLQEDLPMGPDAPGGMVEFRRSLAASFLYKFFVFAALRLEEDSGAGLLAGAFSAGTVVSAEERSAAADYHRPPAKGLQYTEEGPNADGAGASIMHMAADVQVTGEAQYADDAWKGTDCLHAALVLSDRPHARIQVDSSPALDMPGVEGYFSAKDVPGGNDIGAVLPDEEVFATEKVTCVGQVIGIVVADTEANAREAARAVKVTYEDLEAVISIEDAIAARTFYAHDLANHAIAKGDVDSAWAQCEVVVEGEGRCGGQEHFYLEPHVSILYPGENDEMTMLSSTQCPMKHQKSVAHVLGVPYHKVQCKTKRIGGGFGGKETRSAFLCCAAAVPAHHLGRPVRICLDRDEDMASTGHRHAFLSKYKVGFSRDGRIQAYEADFYNNAGNSLDLSASIMDRCLFHADAAYNIPHMKVTGHVCLTNTPSNTAFRGFGGPQGMLLTEMVLERVAGELGLPVEAVRARNMYEDALEQETHYGQKLELCRVETCYKQVLASSQFDERRAAVDAFNKGNRYRKRGLAITPTKFGISFTAKFLNQAGALVHVYTDGTVLVTHGGVEMGQGLHTKMAQLAATTLGIPVSKVYIAETNTDKVPNASPTAASASSDMYGGAVQNACEQLNKRLAPVKASLGAGAKWEDVVSTAYFERIDLSSHGFYVTPDLNFDFAVGKGRPFNYLCYGAACAEVEIDTLTGDFHVLRADLLMDVGTSINPAIDVGQVEGGFVQGLGWVAIEELVWGDKEHKWVKPGTLFTRGPGTYKIPSVNDIPIDFRVGLLKDSPNPRAVYSSKAVGEPPFHLAACAFFALKDAVKAAREHAGLHGWFQLDSPATPERLRMACADTLTAPYADPHLRPKQSA